VELQRNVILDSIVEAISLVTRMTRWFSLIMNVEWLNLSVIVVFINFFNSSKSAFKYYTRKIIFVTGTII
jgi:hypothetical protein